jgi:orotidine-5'-phosphate decarboxylase
LSRIKDQSFTKRLREIQAKHSSLLCIGLDPDPERLPPDLVERSGLAEAVVAFNTSIIESTFDLVCAYKLNLAFYESLGERSWDVMRETVNAIPDDVLVIADGKRGDIGNSARFYADVVFDTLGFDACTVSPYMGRDSVEPFLNFPGRGVFVLVRTSNPGARDFQELEIASVPLYEHVARSAMSWQGHRRGDLGFVVGATDTGPLRAIRSFAPDMPLLIPGIGAQGGDASTVMDAAGAGPVLVSSSRQVIFASAGADFAAAARRTAEEMRARLQRHDVSR